MSTLILWFGLSLIVISQFFSVSTIGVFGGLLMIGGIVLVIIGR